MLVPQALLIAMGPGTLYTESGTATAWKQHGEHSDVTIKQFSKGTCTIKKGKMAKKYYVSSKF